MNGISPQSGGNERQREEGCRVLHFTRENQGLHNNWSFRPRIALISWSSTVNSFITTLHSNWLPERYSGSYNVPCRAKRGISLSSRWFALFAVRTFYSIYSQEFVTSVFQISSLSFWHFFNRNVVDQVPNLWFNDPVDSSKTPDRASTDLGHWEKKGVASTHFTSGMGSNLYSLLFAVSLLLQRVSGLRKSRVKIWSHAVPHGNSFSTTRLMDDPFSWYFLSLILCCQFLFSFLEFLFLQFHLKGKPFPLISQLRYHLLQITVSAGSSL